MNLHLRPHWLPVLDLDQTTTAAGSARAACKGSRKLVSVEPPRCLARRITQRARQLLSTDYRTTFLPQPLT